MTVGSVPVDKVGRIEALIIDHPCASHEWFSVMTGKKIEPKNLVSLLVNYDAHASLLRRLLLQVATIMPEPAVGFILENVREEYGSGDYTRAHQLQLFDLMNLVARDFEIELTDSVRALTSGVRQYLQEIGAFYIPDQEFEDVYDIPSISAGAVTATELLAGKEFLAMKKAFEQYGYGNHIWFNHVNVELEHANESLKLVEYFLNSDARTAESIEFGIGGVLMCNSALYDGFLESLHN